MTARIIEKLRFFDPSIQRKMPEPMARTTRTGMLIFSRAAIDLMHLQANDCLCVSVDKQNNIVIFPTLNSDPMGFILKTTGKALYIKAKHIFPKIGIEYKNKRFKFKITEQKTMFLYSDNRWIKSCFYLHKVM